MNVVICIIVLFFTVINLIIYHKIFDVYYFSLGHGLAKEIGASVCVAIIETAILAAILMKVGMIILIILGVLIAIALIVKGIKKLTGNSENTDEVESEQNINSTSNQNTDPKNKINEIKDTIVSNVQKAENAIKTEVASLSGDKEEATPAKESNVQEVSPEMFCPHCGKKILRTAKFCNFCGKVNSYNK